VDTRLRTHGGTIRGHSAGQANACNDLHTLGLWALAGLCSAYQVQLIAEYITAVPDHGRGQALGLASAGLLAVQGIGLLAGGALAQVWAVVPTIAATGAAGLLLSACLALNRACSNHTTNL